MSGWWSVSVVLSVVLLVSLLVARSVATLVLLLVAKSVVLLVPLLVALSMWVEPLAATLVPLSVQTSVALSLTGL